jgi:hypothetical protein
MNLNHERKKNITKYLNPKKSKVPHQVYPPSPRSIYFPSHFANICKSYAYYNPLKHNTKREAEGQARH